MQASLQNARIAGSCNFCNRGRVQGLDYLLPYKEVYVVSGHGLVVRFCPDCMEKISDINALVDSTKVFLELTREIK